MSFSNKVLPMLGLAMSVGVCSAQAHNVENDNVIQPPQTSWVRNFGFIPPVNANCTDVQTGFWPRPLECKR